MSVCSVADCAQVAADVVERGWAAADRLFFVGGSHSGFIGAHLAGQYPTLFQAFSLRNAVTNIAAMAAATDIGDWCLEEVGLPGAHAMAAQLGPDAEAAKKAMVNTTARKRFVSLRCGAHELRRCSRRKCSPRRRTRTCTPWCGRCCSASATLTAASRRSKLGSAFSSTSLVHALNCYRQILLELDFNFDVPRFHHALQERGVDSRLLVYPGQTHPISKPDMDGDLHVNTARWCDARAQMRCWPDPVCGRFARYDVGTSKL